MTLSLQFVASNVLPGPKAYCTCRKWVDGFSSLCTKSKRGTYPFVCGNCRRPSKEVWRAWKERCPDCLTVFSSPYETVCRDCKADSLYMSWKWAGQLCWVLDDGTKFFSQLKEIP